MNNFSSADGFLIRIVFVVSVGDHVGLPDRVCSSAGWSRRNICWLGPYHNRLRFDDYRSRLDDWGGLHHNRGRLDDWSRLHLDWGRLHNWGWFDNNWSWFDNNRGGLDVWSRLDNNWSRLDVWSWFDDNWLRLFDHYGFRLLDDDRSRLDNNRNWLHNWSGAINDFLLDLMLVVLITTGV